MIRWILLVCAAFALWWLYGQGGFGPGVIVDPAAPPSTTPREPSGRLGGGLNPFVADTDIDAMPQRPQVPAGLGQR